MTVVSNASPLIALSLIDRFEIVFELFQNLIISPAVYNEIQKEPTKSQLLHAHSQNQIQIVIPLNVSAISAYKKQMGHGESETIVLAQQLSADFILIDEKRGRQETKKSGLTPLGTAGILKLWCNSTNEPLSPLIAALQNTGFWISDEILQDILN